MINLNARVAMRYDKLLQDKNSLLQTCTKKLYKDIDERLQYNEFISPQEQGGIVKQILCLESNKVNDPDYDLLNTNTSRYMTERVTRGTTLLLVAMYLKLHKAISKVTITQFWNWIDGLGLDINFAPCKNSMNRYINAIKVESGMQQSNLFTLQGISENEWFKCFKTKSYDVKFIQDASWQKQPEYFSANNRDNTTEALPRNFYPSRKLDRDINSSVEFTQKRSSSRIREENKYLEEVREEKKESEGYLQIVLDELNKTVPDELNKTEMWDEKWDEKEYAIANDMHPINNDSVNNTVSPKQEANNAIMNLMEHMKSAVGTRIEERFVPGFVFKGIIPRKLKEFYIDKHIQDKLVKIISTIQNPQTISRIISHANKIESLLGDIRKTDISASDMIDLLDNFLYFYMLDCTKYQDPKILSAKANNSRLKSARELATKELNKLVTIEDDLISHFLLPILNVMKNSDKNAAYMLELATTSSLVNGVKSYFLPAIYPSKLLKIIGNIDKIEVLFEIENKANEIKLLYDKLAKHTKAIKSFFLCLMVLMSDITSKVDLNKFIQAEVRDIQINLNESKPCMSESIESLKNNLLQLPKSPAVVKLSYSMPEDLKNLVVPAFIKFFIINSISKSIELCKDVGLLSRIKHNIDKINAKCILLREHNIGFDDVYNLFESISVLMAIKKNVIVDKQIDAKAVKNHKELATKAVKLIEKIENELLSYNSWYLIDIKKLVASAIKYYVLPTQYLLHVVNETNDVATLKLIENTAEQFSGLYNKLYKKDLNKQYGVYVTDIILHAAMLAHDLASTHEQATVIQLF